MALIDATQSNSLWDNASKAVRVDVDGLFYTYRIISVLLGFEYTYDSRVNGGGLDENSTPTEIKVAAIAYFETLTFKGSDPIGKETNI